MVVHGEQLSVADHLGCPSDRNSLSRSLTFRFLALLAALVFGLIATLTFTDRVRATCEPEPASQWAPAGFVCEPRFGIGAASVWDGSGLAVNWCSYPWICDQIRVTSLDTGLSIVGRPVTWCHCYVEAPGPNGEGPRIVDLNHAALRALGLWDRFDRYGQGLFPVRVTPLSSTPSSKTLPDTAMPR